MHKTKYDIVIIGSGLGGLLSGALLAKNGKRVCVLEKHYQIGGNLQVFSRNGCRFSAGMHYAGSLDKDQIVYKIFNYLNIYKDLKIKRLDIDNFERIIIGDKEYSYAQGADNFKHKLISYFPDEQNAIERYCKKLDEVWNYSNLLNLRPLNFDEMPLFEEYKENAYEYICSITDNEELRNVLAATNGLYIGNKHKTPLFIHANINNFYIKSAWRIAEDGANMANLLADIITTNGGAVLPNNEVVKLNFKDESIVSATVESGKSYFADHFISDIHPVNTFDLTEPGKLRKVYIKRIQKLENSISAFVLFIVLKKKTVKHINSNIYYSKDVSVWDSYDYTESSWPKGYMMYTTEDNKHKGYAESVVVISMMKFDDVKKWEHTKIMHRGDEYLRFKELKQSKLLDLIAVKFPEIKNNIDHIYSASPLTFRDYTGTPEGSMYGIVKDNNNPLGTFLSPKTKIPNLLLTGQNIGLHGLLGVIMSSFQTCSALIDINSVLTKIKTF